MSLTPRSTEPAIREYLVTSKHFEWQAFINGRWVPIENDYVIEAHYTQPGAKQIKLNTSSGCVCVDFDLLHGTNMTSQCSPNIRRTCNLPPGQTEDMAWYFRDNQLWKEYGRQSSGTFPSSVSSKDIELQFLQNPQGSISFTVGSTGYTLDFASMSQINITTGMARNVRRRPKLQSLGAPRWQFLDFDGVWKDYSRDYNRCNVASCDIELLYRQNLQKMSFATWSFEYEISFTSMTQQNLETNTMRKIRRLEQ
ncbi:uncharacterized protein LOC130518996 isoform X1 [Takifugu flavidus]|uniref:WWE domain-containing protein n=1 Tax=Takifugu bimaculatus TaxID=433685 RepID=A0A4Z2BIT9_9TELE|nr:uncharacterized protein LOC130518996 isoform X1 [Takifugu flavidus]TNM91667.1 hypothetical protein fugu_020047 [Takifugu bimaculatus]